MSPLCHSKSTWFSFFCGIQRKKFTGSIFFHAVTKLSSFNKYTKAVWSNPSNSFLWKQNEKLKSWINHSYQFCESKGSRKHWNLRKKNRRNMSMTCCQARKLGIYYKPKHLSSQTTAWLVNVTKTQSPLLQSALINTDTNLVTRYQYCQNQCTEKKSEMTVLFISSAFLYLIYIFKLYLYFYIYKNHGFWFKLLFILAESK